MTSTTWGGDDLPDPVSVERYEEFVGSQYLAGTGALVTDTIASKYRYAVAWGLITSDERDLIKTKATTQASTALVVPGILTADVQPIRGSYRESPIGASTIVYNVACEVRT